MKIYISLQSPYEWVKVDGRRVEAFGEVPSIDQFPISDDLEVIGVVPGEWVTIHQVNIPAKNKKQFFLALPYSLEEAISEDVENMHFICPNWKSAEDCIVLAVSKEKMRYWQQLANEHQLPIEKLIPDHALIPFHDASDCSIAQTEGVILAHHKNGFGVSIDENFLDIWMMNLPVSTVVAVNDKELTEQLIEANPDRDIRHWPFGTKMAHWLEYPPNNDYDLWGDHFRPSVRRLNWHSFALPIALLFLAVFAKFAFDSYRWISLHNEISSIDQEMQEIVSTTFPQIDYVEPNRERITMQQAIARLGGVKVKNTQTILAEISSVLRRENVTITNMSLRNSVLEITCLLNDFSQVDKLSKQLNARPSLSVNLVSSASDDGQIIASYKIKHS